MEKDTTHNCVLVLDSLKEKIRQSRYRAVFSVNKELLLVYWEIRNSILQQQQIHGWGAKIIDRLTVDLKSEFLDLKGLSVRNLNYMRSFAEAYPNFGITKLTSGKIKDTKNDTTEFVQVQLEQLPNNIEREKSANYACK